MQTIRPFEFSIRDRVWRKTSPMKCMMRFGRKGKISPKFIGLFEILRKVGEVAYELALPLQLLVVYHLFHVSMLYRYSPDELHVISYDSIELGSGLSYEKELATILDRLV